MNSRHGLGWCLVGLAAFGGCGDPRIAPVMPPGVPAPRLAPPDAAGISEARGETPAASSSAEAAPSLALADPTSPGQEKKLASGLVYLTEKPGDGPQVKPGQTATIRYVGRLQDGTKFYDTADEGGTKDLAVGKGAGMKGLHEGVSGMKVGERRKLIVPGHEAYGAEGVKGVVPPNADIVLDVELVGVK
jgi:peptidylprolyl isomerase